MKNTNNKEICGVCKESFYNNYENSSNSSSSTKTINLTEKKVFTCEACDKSFHKVNT